MKLDGKPYTIKLAPGEFTITDPDEVVVVETLPCLPDVTCGPAVVEVPLSNGGTVLVVIEAGEQAQMTEREDGSIEVDALVGTVAVNGAPLTPGDPPLSLHVGSLSGKLSLVVTVLTLSATITPSSVLDPLHEPVSLSIGSYSFFIPAGSFAIASDGAYSYKGTLNGVRLSVQMKPVKGGRWSIKLTGKPVSGLGNPVLVTVLVGDDVASRPLTASTS